jgi:ribonuclease HI
MKIKDLVKTKNIQIDLVKVKSHSKDKWNDRADSLAKKRNDE